MTIRATIALFCLALLPSTLIAQTTEANHNATIYNTAEQCMNALKSPFPINPITFTDTQNLKVISWNIEKGSNEGWKEELKELAKDAQLALLQEAVFIDKMKQPHETSIYWSFSEGYKTKKYRSGIMTLSRIEPSFICSLRSQEPWLKSPKITSITHFPLLLPEQALVVVNLHALNFTLGIRSFKRQLKGVEAVLNKHDGPIILSGDFNTWKKSRQKILQDITNGLGLHEVNFDSDHRIKKFGHPLDFIFTRGFDVKKSSTVAVTTSDHNPLIVTLSLKEK